MITEQHPAFDPAGGPQQMAELPRYRCHKEVCALKIARIEFDHQACLAFIVPTDSGYARVAVPPGFIAKHNPQPGGYYVVYNDGYKSFSPAEAFEEGYTRV
jgi:hypothetical protein